MILTVLFFLFSFSRFVPHACFKAATLAHVEIGIVFFTRLSEYVGCEDVHHYRRYVERPEYSGHQ